IHRSLARGPSAKRLPSWSSNIDHQPQLCWTGGGGNSTPRAQLLVRAGEIVAVEEDVRRGQLVGRRRTAALPKPENEDGRLVPRPHLDPASRLAVGCVLGELELHCLCPELQSTILVFHLDNDVAHSFDHVSLPRGCPATRAAWGGCQRPKAGGSRLARSASRTGCGRARSGTPRRRWCGAAVPGRRWPRRLVW